MTFEERLIILLVREFKWKTEFDTQDIIDSIEKILKDRTKYELLLDLNWDKYENIAEEVNQKVRWLFR
jgi:hypothetical protein